MVCVFGVAVCVGGGVPAKRLSERTESVVATEFTSSDFFRPSSQEEGGHLLLLPGACVCKVCVRAHGGKLRE